MHSSQHVQISRSALGSRGVRSLEFLEHLEAVYRNLSRRIDADSSLIASNLNDRDLDVVANDD